MARGFPSLPVEILDTIVALIQEHSDLLSLALTTRSLSFLVLPHHAEYRIVRLATRHPEVWAHLAERLDLARNIDALYLIEDPHYLPLPERYPVTLIPGAARESGLLELPNDEHERVRVLNVVGALRNMTSLRRFVWIQPWASGIWMDNPSYYRDILQVLTQLPSLRELKIFDTSLGNVLDDTSPLWHVKGLQSIQFEGCVWMQSHLHPHLVSMLKGSNDLQTLSLSTIPVSPDFWSYRFTHLRRLNLSGNSIFHNRSDDEVLEFLEAHPSIEDLTWFPCDMDSKLCSGSLPGLKRLISGHEFALSLVQDRIGAEPRAFDCLSRLIIDPLTLQSLAPTPLGGLGDSEAEGGGTQGGGGGGGCLKELHVLTYDAIESIHRLSELYPTLQVLDIKGFGPQDRSDGHASYSLDDYIDALSRFSALECLPDVTLWEAIQQVEGDEQRDGVLMRLSEKCPNLRVLGHWDDQSRRVVDVHLKREPVVVDGTGTGSGKVTWLTKHHFD
ncbi:hypothetical protein BDN72DRAFT_377966 [Pluteus cervinus]|uniref:Uncharacterized protein n=1 Tax=Pluteus cervinus TaxID=181527 RepID=A0ACD3AAC9_9AGAR|nr:hypothetical protein BDN72DRAFT_377966 [Pluteus cervinus]